MSRDFLKHEKELKALRSKEAYATELARKAKQLNQRFYRLEKSDVSLKSSYAYQRAIEELGKEKPRYSQSKNVYLQMDFSELEQLLLDIDVKLESSSSTIRGMRKLEVSRWNSIADTLGIENTPKNKEALKSFFEFGGKELFKYGLDSSLLLEDFIDVIESGKANAKDYIIMLKREFNSVLEREQDIDYNVVLKAKKKLIDNTRSKNKRLEKEKKKIIKKKARKKKRKK